MDWSQECMVPVWTGNTVYEESVMFIQKTDGQTEAAQLLYRAERILKVCSSDRKTVYEEGADYILQEGMLARTEESRMPVWEHDEFYGTEPGTFAISSKREPGKYIRFDGGDVYAAHQVIVTYTHQDGWEGIVPWYQGAALPGAERRLKERQSLKIVYYGDSIMEGCDVSSRWNMEPFLPQLSDLVTARLASGWGHGQIRGINTALGGTDTAWGLREIQERVCAHEPDLVVMAFGMNDGHWNSPRLYETNVREMIARVRETAPQAEFLLVATMLPNPDGVGWTCWQPMYQWNLKKIAAEVPGVAVAPMTDVSAYLLSRKKFEDMTGNGINHPNDFLVRVYAQVITASLVQ